MVFLTKSIFANAISHRKVFFKGAPYDVFLTPITRNNRLAIYGWIVNQFEARQGGRGCATLYAREEAEYPVCIQAIQRHSNTTRALPSTAIVHHT